MRTDRSESNNLADQQPEKVRELADRWTRMAEEFLRTATADSAKSKG
jgi:hypothetical protein